MRLGLLLGLLALVIVSGVVSAEVVDSGEILSNTIAIAVDSNGNPHISYIKYLPDSPDNSLMYAYKDASGWHIETVYTGYGVANPSIAVDSNGNPHIYYQNFSSGNLMHAYKDIDGWHIETVDNRHATIGGNIVGSLIGSYNSIAVDSHGYPHVAYTNYTQRLSGDLWTLKYAYRDSNAWHIMSVDIGQADVRIAGVSIAIDSNDNPYILYEKIYGKIGRYETTLNFAHKTSNGWQYGSPLNIHGEHIGDYPSLALDSNDYPHIAYYNSSTGEIKYAYQDASGWHLETVTRTADGMGYMRVLSIAVNTHPGAYLTSPGVYISYYNARWYNRLHGDLNVAERWLNPITHQYGWNIEIVDRPGDVGLYPFIAVDSNGNPHISYYDDTNEELKYTTKQPTIVNLQGGIVDKNTGNPVATASMQVTVKDQNGNSIYSEVFNDVVKDGKFNTLLGATQELKLWSDAKYNLIIDVDVDSTAFSSADVTFGDNTPAGDVIVFYP